MLMTMTAAVTASATPIPRGLGRKLMKGNHTKTRLPKKTAKDRFRQPRNRSKRLKTARNGPKRIQIGGGSGDRFDGEDFQAGLAEKLI